jgi:drug/metabolite transporter (DMT)-like permease
MLAALLALTASLLWGTSDFLGGFESRRASVWAVALVSQAVALVTALIVLAIVAPTTPSAAQLIAPLVAGIAITLSALAEYRSMELAEMSLVAPVFAGAAIVPVLWGIALGERPGAVQVAGMALTIAGIVLIARPERRAPDAKRHVSRAGVLLAVFAAVMIGVVLVAYDYGGDVDPYWTVAVARVAALLTLGIALAIRRPTVRFPAKSIPGSVAIGVFLLTANVLFTVASTMGLLSVVAVLGWLSPAGPVARAPAPRTVARRHARACRRDLPGSRVTGRAAQPAPPQQPAGRPPCGRPSCPARRSCAAA